MKTSIYNELQRDGCDVHRCVFGSDRHCYYVTSKNATRDSGDKDGRIFQAIREAPDGDLKVGATVSFFVSRSAKTTTRVRALIGDFDGFVIRAGVSHIRELLRGDLSVTSERTIELHSLSPDEDFQPLSEPDPVAEQKHLRSTILRVLAELHSDGSKRIAKGDLLQRLCTNLDWVDRALTILEDQSLIDGARRGEIKLTSAGHLKAEQELESQSRESAYPLRHEQGAKSDWLESSNSGRIAVTEASSDRSFDLFVSYASEDRSTVEQLIAVLEGRGVRLWWDRGEIALGDRLSQKIDQGLQSSRYGVVIISKSFMEKRWPENELRYMVHRSISSGEKVILPVLLSVTHEEVAQRFPLIADIVSSQFSNNFEQLANEIMRAIGNPVRGAE